MSTDPMDPFFSGVVFRAPVDTRELELQRLRQDSQRLKEILASVDSQPMGFGVVLRVGPKKSVIISGGQMGEVMTPPEHLVKIRPGMPVLVDAKKAIIAPADPPAFGHVLKVNALVDDCHAEVTTPIGSRLVVFGMPTKVGDRVVLDPAEVAVVRNLGPEKATAGAGVDTSVSWDDIGGQDEAKLRLQEAIESSDGGDPYSQERVNGVLLCGPPGCGKTMLGKATATALAVRHGRQTTASGFQYVKGPELLHGLVGSSEANVRKLFSSARVHKAEHGYPGVIFLDEADALLTKRGGHRLVQGMESTIVPMFLTEMDGLEDSAAMVILATNRPEQLDSAVVREGRIDAKVYVTRPPRKDCLDILRKQLRGKPLRDLTHDEAAEKATDALFAKGHVLGMMKSKSGKDARFTLGDIASGALCSGLVQRATMLAKRRDKGTGKVSGIGAEDLAGGARMLFEEQKILDWSDDVVDVAKKRCPDMIAFDRCA